MKKWDALEVLKLAAYLYGLVAAAYVIVVIYTTIN